MRKTTIVGLMLLGFGAIVLVPAVTIGQPPGGGKGGGGKGFGGGGFGASSDPGALFDMLDRNKKGFILISDMRMLKEPLTQFAQERGISNGQITRQQFLDFQDQLKNKLTQPGGGGGGFEFKGKDGGGGFPPKDGAPGGGFPFGGFKGKDGGGGGGPGPGMGTLNPEAVNEWADKEFKKRDTNGDGKLNLEEMSDTLRRNLARWDKDGDSFISLSEFREYFMARLQGDDGNTAKAIASIIIEDDELDRKVVVHRVGNLPKNLPSWFKELDTDGDGQVALCEWRAGRKNLEEFALWDMNDDGLITIEEALRQQDVLAKNSKGDGSLSSMMYGNQPGQRPGDSGSDKGKGKWGGFGGGNGGGFFGGFGGGTPGMTDGGGMFKDRGKGGGKDRKGGGN